MQKNNLILNKFYKYMKRTLLFSLPSLYGWIYAQNVGIGTSTPDASAKLEIDDANRGILIPRVALTATNAAGPVTSPATSLLVYNTATAGTVPNNVTPGYYYWDGTQWVRLMDTESSDWKLDGNTNGVLRYIGTNDNFDFPIHTNGTEKVRVTAGGYVGIGTTNPQRILHVVENNNFGHIQPSTALFRLQNSENTTCAGNDKFWDFRVGNCGQFGIITTDNNINPNFNILKANDLLGPSDGPVVSLNSTAPIYSIFLDGNGRVGFGLPAPTNNFHLHTSSTGASIIGRYTSATTGSTSSDGIEYGFANAGSNFYMNNAEGGGFQWWTSGTERVRITGAGNVGISATAPAVQLAVGGNGTNVYATNAWIENNMHVQGNETLNQGGRGRLRVGTAWGYMGLYTDVSSTSQANDLVLGSSTGLVRIGPNGGGQNLRVSGLEGTGNRAVYADANGILRTSTKNIAYIQSRSIVNHDNSNVGWRVVGPASTNMDVSQGDIIAVTISLKFRWTGGSGGDHPFFGIRINGSCGTIDVVDLIHHGTADDVPRNQWQSVAFQYVWVATCDGTINLNVICDNNTDSDDSSQYHDIVLVATRH